MFASDYTAILISRLVLGAGLWVIQLPSDFHDFSLVPRYETRAQMLGWRAAAEQIGQACTLAIAGLILSYAGWHASFAVYLLAFVVLSSLQFVFLTIAKHKIITLQKTILLKN